MITGLKPDGGAVHLADEDITKTPMYIRARLGWVAPQESSILKN